MIELRGMFAFNAFLFLCSCAFFLLNFGATSIGYVGAGFSLLPAIALVLEEIKNELRIRSNG